MGIEIRESVYSLETKFIELIERYCPGLIAERSSSNALLFYQRKGIFNRKGKRVIQAEEDHQCEKNGVLSYSDRIEKMTVKVRDAGILEDVQKATEIWAMSNQCEVVVVKEF